MSKIELATLLDLIKALRDGESSERARKSFHIYLREKVKTAEDVREYLEDALVNPEDLFQEACKDLVNHLGYLLGFRVLPGRHPDIHGDADFDGLWRSPTGWSIIVQTETRETSLVKTASLLGCIDLLTRDGKTGQPEQSLCVK